MTKKEKTMTDKVTITNLELENVKRVRAVAISPAANGLTLLGGKNRQGKTSVLDAICYALGGESYRPSELQNREGIATARMDITLSNGLRVTRAGKNAALKVTDPAGRKAGQTLLNSFIEELALNLPKFLNSNSKDKAKTLLRILGIEDQLAALEQEERKLMDERLLAGREADRKAKYADELPEYPEAPDEPLSGADMSRKLQAALSVNAENEAKRRQINRLENDLESQRAICERLRAELARAEEAAQKLSNDLKAAKEAAKDLQDVDTSTLDAELEQIDVINNKVRTNQEKSRAKDEAEQAKAIYTALNNKVADVRKRRDDLLASVELPLPGLSVEAGELIYNGSKWDCMSGMEKIRVATAIVRKLKPSCGFILLDGLEAFDNEELENLRNWLVAEGLQAIGTKVCEDGADIIIEDGMVVGAPPPQQQTEEPENELEGW